MVKNEILTNMALIADMIDKIGFKNISTNIIINTTPSDFDRLFDFFENRTNKLIEKPKTSFKVKIDNVEFEFNKNNV